jgi:hypothetical protein
MKELKYSRPLPDFDRRVDTLDKMKAAIPSLEKYTSQSCAEETFAEIYHWTFTYLKEGGIRKVVDLEVPTTRNLVD